MRFERRDISLALMMLLALAAGLGLGAIIMGGGVSPASREGLGALAPPPGSEVQQTAAASDPVPLPMEEMTVIEPVKVVERPLDLSAYEWAIYTEVNNRRVEHGLLPLVWSDAVANVARKHSTDEARRGYYSHITPEGTGLAERFFAESTTHIIAENLLYVDRPTMNTMANVDSWMNSPGHRATILGQYHLTGVGIAIDAKGQVYITQNFVS